MTQIKIRDSCVRRNGKSLLNQNSLSETLDNLNQMFFDNTKIPAAEKKQIAKWISGRQGLPGSYWNMFSPTSKDLNGIKLFTGEVVNSSVGVAHFLGEEACRALYLLNVKESFKALESAEKGLSSAIKNARKKGFRYYGFYCCGKCSVAYWRNLTAEGVIKNKKLLQAGMKILKSYRDGKDKWRRFPFYYTLYTLAEIDIPEAKEELKYVYEVCERLIRTMRKEGKYEERRYKLVKRVLEKV